MARGGSESFKQRVNLVTGFILPIAILSTAAYSIYVVVYLLCVEYLIRKTERPSTAAAIITLYFLFFIPTWMAYCRFLSTLFLDNGFIPRGRPHHQQEPALDKASLLDSTGLPPTTLDKASILSGTLPPPPGLHKFYTKNIFICDSAGLPIYCSKCHNWKPDRTHHCSENGRCVRRMDHFCPWMGGVVSETNMKFFLQFGFWAMVSCGYIFGVVVWGVVNQKRRSDNEISNGRVGEGVNDNFIATAVVAAMFALMAFGVLANWGKLSAWNQTTVESLGRSNFLAVLIPSSSHASLPTITYPLAMRSTTSPAYPDKIYRKHRRRRSSSGSHAARNAAPRTFAVIQTGPHNPWDLKSRMDNLKTILGNNYLDWIIPFRSPPCTRHDDPDGDYPWGPAIERLCKENGIEMPGRIES